MSKANGKENFFVRLFVPLKADSAAKKSAKIISLFIMIFVVAVIIVSALVLRKYLVASANNDDWNAMYKEVSGTTLSKDAESEVKTEEFDDKKGISKDFSALVGSNPDVVGYLSIKGTDMSVPVVQGKDNSFYLNHDLYRKESAFGIPFADYRATFSKNYQSSNITIYGHPNKNGSYLYAVKSYKDIDFYKENPIVDFNTIYGRGEYVVIARFIADVDLESPELFNYHDYVDMDEEKFNYFIETINSKSYFESSVDVAFGDSLLTLSTCNDEIDPSTKTKYRDVLVARKLRPDEARETIDVSESKINVDMVMPSGWMEKFNMTNPYN